MTNSLEKALIQMGLETVEIANVVKAVPARVRDMIQSFEPDKISRLLNDLIYVHITRNTYPGRGVRRENCKGDGDSVYLLQQLGLVDEEQWGAKIKHTVVIDTNDGRKISEILLRAKIRALNSNEIRSMLHPITFWICRDIVVKSKEYTLPTTFPNSDPFAQSDKPVSQHLLNTNASIFDKFKEFADKLVEAGIVGLANGFNSNNIWEKEYVFPEETDAILEPLIKGFDPQVVTEIESCLKAANHKYQALDFLYKYKPQAYQGLGNYRQAENEILFYLRGCGGSVKVVPETFSKGFSEKLPFIILDRKSYENTLNDFKKNLVDEMNTKIDEIVDELKRAGLEIIKEEFPQKIETAKVEGERKPEEPIIQLPELPQENSDIIIGCKDQIGTLDDVKQSLLDCFSPSNKQTSVSQEFLSGLEMRLKEILSEFNIPCDVDHKEFDVGPRLVRANIRLGKGIKIAKLTRISEDIANKLFSDKRLFTFDKDDEVPKNVLIESVPAKGAVGIYLPRSKFTPVGIREILQAFPLNNTLNFSIGKNIIGENQYSNLEEMPHLLIAGHTGSGKSVFLNSLIVGLIFQNSPKDLGLILIDPKIGLEFGSYESLPFLKYDSIIDSPEEAEEVLHTVIEEMEKRYRIFKKEKVRKLSEFNSKNKDRLPYLVIIIDEFANIILNEKGKTRKELASLVQKLAEKGRAAGVHIIIAAQKPVNECFPTMIKTNIPARIAFRVTKSEESLVILGETGAETLFGKGDMLVKDPDMGGLRRFQAPYIKYEEIECFVDKVKNLWE